MFIDKIFIYFFLEFFFYKSFQSVFRSHLSFLPLGQTCERKCGETLDLCSCHPTCNSLGNCCVGFTQYCVEMSPYSGTIMGGTDFTIKAAVFPANSTVVCRLAISSSFSPFRAVTQLNKHPIANRRGSMLKHEMLWQKTKNKMVAQTIIRRNS